MSRRSSGPSPRFRFWIVWFVFIVGWLGYSLWRNGNIIGPRGSGGVLGLTLGLGAVAVVLALIAWYRR